MIRMDATYKRKERQILKRAKKLVLVAKPSRVLDATKKLIDIMES